MFLGDARKFRSVLQTYLEGGDRNALTIVDRDKPRPEKAYISKLPDEILSLIICLAALDSDPFRWGDLIVYDSRVLKKLALTCRRFSWIALPLFYGSISVSVKANARSLRKANRTLRSHTARQDQCHTLSIRITEDYRLSREELSWVADLIAYFPKLQSLDMDRGYRNEQNMIRFALQTMPELQSLALDSIRHGLFLRDVFTNPRFQSLQRLELSSIRRPHDGSEDDYALGPEKYQCTSIPSLSLRHYRESAEATERLLQWPRSLVHFRLWGHYDNWGYRDGFGNYQRLFYIDLPMLDEEWLRQFARAVVVKGANLRTIKIVFTPETWGYKADGYPWDRMDDVHKEVQPHGLRLEYTKPPLTKDEWLKKVGSDHSPTHDIGLRHCPEDDTSPSYEGEDITTYFNVA